MTTKTTKRPRWLRRGARVRIFEDWKIENVTRKGWIWMRNDDGGLAALHVRDLGKTWDRVPTKRGRHGKG